MPPVTRRQFLAGLGLGGVAAAVGAVLRFGGRSSAPAPAAAGSTTAPTTTTTRPATTTSSRATTTSSTPPPTTTTTPTTTSPATTSATSTTPATTTTSTPAGARVVEVIGRQAWGAADQRGGLPAHAIERITVHHTAARLDDNTRAPGRLLGYQRFHQDAGFVDLAYHVLIDGNGNVYAGRDPAIPGETFTDYDPTGHYLPVLDGNFDEQPVPPAQLEALVDVVAWAVAEYRVDVGTIAGHRDYAATACPGASLYPLVTDGSLARLVSERLAAGGVRLALLDPGDGAARVAAIQAGRA